MNSLADDSYDRIQDARLILESLGMDAERSNERSALVFLALANLTPKQSWREADNPLLGTRAIMNFIRDEYGKAYAPNTRETIRRFTLHQFVEAHLTVQNPDRSSSQLSQVELPTHRRGPRNRPCVRHR